MTDWFDVSAAALVVALWIDFVWGEPPARWHPVVWMGRYLDWVTPWFAPQVHGALTFSNQRAFFEGMVFWLVGAVACVCAALALTHVVDVLPFGIAVVIMAIGLKPLFAWTLLFREVQAVELALSDSLEAARARLAWLCSRDVSQLSAAEVRETAIETLAENLNDSVVAPLFWFVMFGLPGAVVYRFSNTADAMWGYNGQRGKHDWRWAGKWAARADDVLSWVPARLTAALLALMAGGVSLRALRREAVKTPSPNSGWPMAAMALALDVHLEKPQVYCLHPDGQSPQKNDTERALHLSQRVVWVVGLIGFVVIEIAKVQI